MRVDMTDGELALFAAFVSCSSRYLEFGSGGSTYLAAQSTKEWIISVESSPEWVEKVTQNCAGLNGAIKIVHADIGPVKEFGHPIDAAQKSNWPTYHEAVWNEPNADNADFCFVDGRFRVACFLQVLLRAKRPDIVIAIHDFSTRPHYHIILPFVRAIAVVERLSIFVPRPGFDRHTAEIVLNNNRFRPD